MFAPRGSWVAAILCPLLFLGSVGSASAVASRATNYRIRDLGSFEGQDTLVHGINDAGAVVGRFGTYHPATWSPSTGWTALPVLPGDDQGYAQAINDRGAITGSSGSPILAPRPVLWRNGVVRAIPLAPGMAYGEGESINAKGEVAGYETTADTPLTQPFVWAPKDGLTLLPLLPGYDGCWLLPGSTQALNDRGEVVGVCYALDSRGLISHTTAFKWTASTGMAPLDTPPGLSSEGDAVNNRGQVAGQVFELPSLPSEPVVWTRTSRVSRLPHGAPRGKYFAGINQPGSIVFGTFIDSTEERPYVITRRSGLNFLETLPGGTFADGADINGRGVIAGGADTGTGAIHAVLFMPCTCRSHGTQQPRGAASESRSDHEGAPIGERRQSLHSASPTPHR